ncbi:MAG: lycopene cyclase domain-containing protein [Micrococcaceae bacterium]|nr:lycopene cyclase domain-containing protein [Micrococcaceae bacterium]
MAQYEYLLLMAACVLITLPLEFLLRARVYRRLPLMLPSVLVVVLVFGLWDLVGIARDHWTYNPEFITGIHLGIMPLEELVFFIVISLCALLSYEGVSTVLNYFSTRKHRKGGPSDVA